MAVGCWLLAASGWPSLRNVASFPDLERLTVLCSLPQFARDLLHEGRVRVTSVPASPASDSREALGVLAAFEHVYRRGQWPQMPSFDPASALAALQWVHAVCVRIVFSDASAHPSIAHAATGLKQIKATVETSATASAATAHTAIYSVDLCLRFLPDLVRLADRHEASTDRLAELYHVAADWPLSAVGLSAVGLSAVHRSEHRAPREATESLRARPPDVTRQERVVTHPALLRLYAERIVERADAEHLSHPALVAEVRRQLGTYSHLACDAIVALLEPGE